MPTPNLPPGLDFSDTDTYAERLPVEEFAEMHRMAPIWWNEQPMGVGGFDERLLGGRRGRGGGGLGS